MTRKHNARSDERGLLILGVNLGLDEFKVGEENRCCGWNEVGNGPLVGLYRL